MVVDAENSIDSPTCIAMVSELCGLSCTALLLTSGVAYVQQVYEPVSFDSRAEKVATERKLDSTSCISEIFTRCTSEREEWPLHSEWTVIGVSTSGTICTIHFSASSSLTQSGVG